MRAKIIKGTSSVLIVTGLALLVWLGWGMKQHKEQQAELLQAFSAIQTKQETTASINQLQSLPVEASDKLPDDVEGVLTVPSIGIHSPVLSGAGPAQLDMALGSIAGMDKPGEMNGSYAIAGHQSHAFGKFFNRLHELKEGDRFSYKTTEETLDFEVFGIEIVKPEEVQVLAPKEGMAMISLVTCYPENSSRYRLVVQGKRIES